LVVLVDEEHGPSSRVARGSRLLKQPPHQLLRRGSAPHGALQLEEQLEMTHALLELVLGFEQLLVLLNDREQETAVVDGDGGFGGQSFEQSLVVGRELPALLLVEHLHDTDGLAHVALEWRGQNRLRAITDELVPVAAEALVAIGVAHPERLTGPGHQPRDAFAHLHPHRTDGVSDRDAGNELSVDLVEQVERGAVGVQKLRDLLQNQLQEIVEVERRAEGHADFAQRGRDALLPGQGRLQIGDSREEELISRLGLEAHHWRSKHGTEPGSTPPRTRRAGRALFGATWDVRRTGHVPFPLRGVPLEFQHDGKKLWTSDGPAIPPTLRKGCPF
jgi:hypothetical protein